MEPQFKTPVTARIRGSDRSLPPFGDRNQLKTNDKVYGMTPPGVFFLAIFQQTANLKQICLYDSAICQQLHFVQHHFCLLKCADFRENVPYVLQLHTADPPNICTVAASGSVGRADSCKSKRWPHTGQETFSHKLNIESPGAFEGCGNGCDRLQSRHPRR